MTKRIEFKTRLSFHVSFVHLSLNKKKKSIIIYNIVYTVYLSAVSALRLGHGIHLPPVKLLVCGTYEL